MQSQAMSHIKSCALATARFLLRPFTVMWPMVVTMVVYYVLAKALLHAHIILLKGALPELYVIALALSILKGRWRTTVTAVTMTLMTALTAIEVFINTHFGLTLASEVFQLMLESSTSETSQFLTSFVLQWSTLPHLIIPLCCAVLAIVLHKLQGNDTLCQRLSIRPAIQAAGLIAFIAYFIYTGWAMEQPGYVYVLGSKNVSDFEKRYIHARESHGCGANTSLTRLGFGAKLYSLTSRQCDEVIATARTATVQGCDHTSPGIMLFIGESGIRRHYQIYGYNKSTTPCQQHEVEQGNLFVMQDVMTPYLQTSEVMKIMLSLHSVDQPGTWTDAPMLPQLMKLAGYRVAYVTNQYAKFSNSVWDSTGGFFMRDDRVGNLMLDYITQQPYRYDDSLLNELDAAMPTSSPYNMLMFHVHGQHVAFADSYPTDRQHFTWRDYNDRSTLNREQKEQVAHYDNSTLYQDSICGELFKRYADKDMVIIFASDHGENVYDDGETLGREHNDFSAPMIDSQYRVPMWIWCSPRYRELHPDMVARIQDACSRPFQTDDMPHLILQLAGAHTSHLDPTRSPISPTYKPHTRLATKKAGH